MAFSINACFTALAIALSFLLRWCLVRENRKIVAGQATGPGKQILYVL